MPPPSNEEAEKAVLSCCISGTDNARESLSKTMSNITLMDFYHTRHANIFNCMALLFESGSAVDVVTVVQRARDTDVLKSCGGEKYIASLLDIPSLHSSIDEYIALLREYRIRRKVMTLGEAAAEQAQRDGTPTMELVERVSQQVMEVSKLAFSENTRDVGSLSERETKLMFEYADAVASGLPYAGSLKTGLHELDRMTSGLHPGSMYIVAARPSVGKTSLSLDIALGACRLNGAVSIIFSLEMTAAELTRRLQSSVGEVDSHNIRSGRLYTDERERLISASRELAKHNLYIDDSPRMSPAEIRARARNILLSHPKKPGLVIVDYLQLMDRSLHDKPRDSRQQEMAEISRAMKAVSKELGVPVLALSQLNREVESRSNAAPRLSDLRESGAIEQDADVVLFLYKKDAREDCDAIVSSRVSIAAAIAKQRCGPTGEFTLMFNKPYTRFENQ